MRVRYKLKNPRISAKERGLLKGAVRRVFSRSDLRRSIIEKAQIKHTDNERPRVKKWGRCAICKTPTAQYQLEVDHIIPIIPINKSLEEISWDELVNSVWCKESDLQATCKSCHKEKTKAENKERRKFKKEKST